MAIVNPDEIKRQAQALQMRGAQMASEKIGQKQPRQASGSRKQLIGTIVGIAAVFALLVLLKLLAVI